MWESVSGVSAAGSRRVSSSAKLVCPEPEGRTVGLDARLTLWVPEYRTISREGGSDLGLSVTRPGRHVFDDASRGVRGDPGAGSEGLLTCGLCVRIMCGVGVTSDILVKNAPRAALVRESGLEFCWHKRPLVVPRAGAPRRSPRLERPSRHRPRLGAPRWDARCATRRCARCPRRPVQSAGPGCSGQVERGHDLGDRVYTHPLVATGEDARAAEDLVPAAGAASVRARAAMPGAAAGEEGLVRRGGDARSATPMDRMLNRRRVAAGCPSVQRSGGVTATASAIRFRPSASSCSPTTAGG